ncbi:MAG: hypothetical protein IJ455_05700 [Agathobacter sp.]|nr:hypothetical protein [Agathobacter sp.]
MKREDELLKQLMDMTKDTKAGKIHWDVKCQTTEYNDPASKPQVMEDDILWTVDECYVSYYCEYKGKEFLMITYEMIHTAGDKVKTTNLVFLPPLGIRYFDIHTLLPYAVENSNMLSYQVKNLWSMLLDMYKANPDSVALDASERVLTIED